MTFNSKFTMAVRKFFKKYGKVVFIVFIVWLIVFLFNMYLRNRPPKLEADKTYNPDKPIIDYGGSVPKSQKEEVNKTLDTYLNYCKNKDYENAFNMITSDCKSYLYRNDINEFKKYVDSVFDKFNNYSYVQNYSNQEKVYTYEVTILNNDILSTGTTGGYEKYQEKITIIEEDGTKKIANQGYITHEDVSKEAEDDFMKVKVKCKDMSYSRVSYKLEVRNKTDKIIVIADNNAGKEVTLNIEGQYQLANNIAMQESVIKPGETKELEYIFDKFYDSKRDETQINFNYVRIIPDYNYQFTLEEQKEKAYKIYSFNINL